MSLFAAIPLGGNLFVTKRKENIPDKEGDSERVTKIGLENWASEKNICSAFIFNETSSGKIKLSLRMKIEKGKKSRIQITNGKEFYKVNLYGEENEFKIVPVGIFQLDQDGYCKFDLKGISKTGFCFGILSHILIDTDCELNFARDDFYFARRGPSVHLKYLIPKDKQIEYFYNELTVPHGQDVIGAYFCAAGFTGGYLGIQVNSETERRVLFSIWSEFKTDNPGEIPEDYKVRLVEKGDGVFIGEFGDEGAGAQSYMKFNWKTGVNYKFVAYGTPFDEENTFYSAWFNGGDEWELIARFIKPKTSIYFNSPYSFSENFIPENGFIERRCLFGRQWARDADGNWMEILDAKFTGDTTYGVNRWDVAAGIEDGKFYLKNCGFFHDTMKTGIELNRPETYEIPIDVSILP